MLVRFVAATLLAGSLVSPSAAQLAIQAVPATPYSPVAAETPAVVDAVPVATAAPAATATPTAEAPKPDDAAANELKQKRLQKIQQLQFDRRPSTILKTWLEPVPKPPVKEAEKPAAPVAAAPAEPAPAAPPDAQPAATAETPPMDPPVAESAPAEPTPEEKAAAEAKAAEAKAAAEKAAADAKAAEEKAKAEAAAKKAAEADAQFDYELKLFARWITLGQWGDAKTYLKSLNADEGKALFEQLITSLMTGATGQPQGFDMNVIQQMINNAAAPAEFQKMLALAGQGAGAAFLEKNQFTMLDIRGLLLAAPAELSDNDLTRIGTLLRLAIVEGNDLDVLLADLHVLPDSKEPALLTKRQVAKLLFAAVEPVRAGQYLPTIDEAAKEQDAPGLNLLARHYLAMHQAEKKDQYLEQAWNATQAALAVQVPESSEDVAPAATPSATETNVPAASEVQAADVFENVSDCNQVVVDVAAIAEPSVEAAPVTAAAPVAATEAKPEPTAEEKAAKDAEKKRIAELKQAKQEALQRAVELAPQVREQLGQAWLDESFTKELTRGQEILATIGTIASTNLMSRPGDADFRLKTLQLERTAVEALLRAAPDKAQEWSDTLTMLAGGWLREAQMSIAMDQESGGRPGYRRDRYGNYFYADEEMSPARMQYNNGMAQPIRLTDIMETRPSDAWLAIVHVDLAPKFAEMFAQLHLKLEEDKDAFPYIEKLAATHPERAKTLAEEFIRVWTKNHNPNEGRENYDPFFYYFAYERRSERIPLTRSKQERNLLELADLVKRLRALPVGKLDERLLTTAFTTAHSRAEVYKLESIESVFGSMENLQPRTLAELIQQMRGNLASVWRAPAVQEQNSTKRKQKDIQAEVQHGYQVARAVVDKGLAKYPDHWALVLADAAVMYDEVDYQADSEKTSTFSESRGKALARFQEAAALYAKAVADIPTDEQTTQPFEMWYYASLGSVDLERITATKTPDLRQPALIREALAALPSLAKAHHLELFANNLFSRASSAKPELKFRYLRTGFEIVGDHKMAREARKLLDYYDDLVTEIKLEARIDGSDEIGQGKPFGVFVNLVHTKEIERESGGFGRYLQNQNTNQNYYYNFGRPLENYRDKFEDIVGQALGEQFDIVSVTFQEDSVTSKALPEYGWRVTPYAYLLLKARGPEVDKLAPLRLDLDFLDTSGYAILPVESAAVPVDASGKNPPARPASDITITQTVDERQSDDGKLILEIRASAHGLVPELEQLVDFKHPGFDIAEMDDGGPAVSKFDNEADATVVSSERIWTIALKPSGDAKGLPDKFAFATAKIPVKEIIYQRYDDADLMPVSGEFALQQKYAGTNYSGIWVPILGVSAAAIVALFGLFGSKQAEAEAQPRFAMPTPVTPFTVIGLLRDIQANNGLTPSSKSALHDAIGQLERHYFLQPAQVEPDLSGIARRWLEETANGGHAESNGR